MEDFQSSPGFEGGGYEGFDFGQAELEFSGSGFEQFSASDYFPESWALNDSEGIFPDTFPENWITGSLPEEDQAGDLYFPEIWYEEVVPSLTSEDLYPDTFPDYWLFGPSMSQEALMEKTTEVDSHLIRTINEIGATVLRRYVRVKDELIELRDPFYPELYPEAEYRNQVYDSEDAETNYSGGYLVSPGLLAINGDRRRRDRLEETEKIDSEAEVFRSFIELGWDETAGCYLLTWRTIDQGPIPSDLLQAIKSEFYAAGNWALSSQDSTLYIYPLEAGRDDSEILELVSNAVEEVYSVAGDQLIETTIRYNL